MGGGAGAGAGAARSDKTGVSTVEYTHGRRRPDKYRTPVLRQRKTGGGGLEVTRERRRDVHIVGSVRV